MGYVGYDKFEILYLRWTVVFLGLFMRVTNRITKSVLFICFMVSLLVFMRI